MLSEYLVADSADGVKEFLIDSESIRNTCSGCFACAFLS